MREIIAGLYVIILVYIGWCSVRSSLKAHGPAATSLEVVTSIAWTILVAAFFWPRIAGVLGPGVAPPFAVATVWTAYTVWRDFRPSVAKAKMPAEIPRGQRNAAYALSAVMCGSIVVPVVLLGTIVVLREHAPAV